MARKAKMTDRDKAIVRGYWFDGKTMAELGAENGVSAQAVHKLIHSAKAEAYLTEIQERTTKKAKSYLIGQTRRAAQVMAEAMDVDDVYARIQAAREILERTSIRVDTEGAGIEIKMPAKLVIGMEEEMTGNGDQS